ncbi:MAG: hypothetical protein K0R63_1806 [Rickettsiales bacterium]|jgi:HlyD family secretion protein|nr:hypothetical protein [Rickettsiales bacterium]
MKDLFLRIKQPKILAVTLVSLAIVGLGISYCAASDTNTTTASTVTAAAPSHSKPASSIISGDGIGALGTIEPRSRVIQLSHDAGPEGARIQKLLVTEGQLVKEGDQIAIFSDNDRKKAKLAIARSGVAMIQARLKAERTNLTYVEKEYNRYTKLVEKNYASQAKQDETTRNYKQSQSTLDALLAELDTATTQMQLAEEELKQSVLLSPIDGTVLKILVRPGERVGDRGVVRIADLSDLDVVAEIYERDMPRVQVGQKAEVVVPGFSDNFAAEVRELGFLVMKNDLNSTDPLADRDSRVIEVRLSLPKEAAEQLQHLIYMRVNVRLKS